MTAAQFASDFKRWAEANGYWAGFDPRPPQDRVALSSLLNRVAEADDGKAEDLLARVEITGLLVDEDANAVTVLAAGRLGPRNSKPLPRTASDVNIEWIRVVSVRACGVISSALPV
jgi:hypothetical protein